MMGIGRMNMSIWGGIFFACLLAPYVSYLHFSVARMHHRWQMWEKAERAHEQTLVLDSASLVWEKKGREIRVNGTFFDVKKITYRNGKALVTGIYDHFEKALVQSFEQEQKNNNDDSKQANILKKGWQFLYCHCHTPLIFRVLEPAIAMNACLLVPKPSGLKNQPLHPPPQFSALT